MTGMESNLAQTQFTRNGLGDWQRPAGVPTANHRSRHRHTWPAGDLSSLTPGCLLGTLDASEYTTSPETLIRREEGSGFSRSGCRRQRQRREGSLSGPSACQAGQPRAEPTSLVFPDRQARRSQTQMQRTTPAPTPAGTHKAPAGEGKEGLVQSIGAEVGDTHVPPSTGPASSQHPAKLRLP